MAKRIQLRRDTAANWTSSDPTLAAGEFGWESDTGKWKVGDGATAWTALDYRSTVTSAEIIAALGYTPMASLITANRQTASYTLVLTDAGKLVEMNVADANNLTVPPNADVAFEIGTQILVSQYGAGQTTIVAGTGVTIRSASGALNLTGQYSGATLVKIAADEWYLFGDITA